MAEGAEARAKRATPDAQLDGWAEGLGYIFLKQPSAKGLFVRGRMTEDDRSHFESTELGLRLGITIEAIG